MCSLMILENSSLWLRWHCNIVLPSGTHKPLPGLSGPCISYSWSTIVSISSQALRTVSTSSVCLGWGHFTSFSFLHFTPHCLPTKPRPYSPCPPSREHKKRLSGATLLSEALLLNSFLKRPFYFHLRCVCIHACRCRWGGCWVP